MLPATVTTLLMSSCLLVSACKSGGTRPSIAEQVNIPRLIPDSSIADPENIPRLLPDSEQDDATVTKAEQPLPKLLSLTADLLVGFMTAVDLVLAVATAGFLPGHDQSQLWPLLVPEHYSNR